MTIHSELKTQNSDPPKPQTYNSQSTTVFMSRSGVLYLVLLLLLAVVVPLFATKPLLALYHQGRAGRLLAEVVAIGDNEYGGFACLRPFIEDLQRESLKTALTHLRKAESLAPKQSHIYFLLGRTFCLLGDYESAIPAFQKFAELRPKNPLGYLEMGFALLQACPPNGKCPDGLNTYDAWHKAGVRAEDFLALAERARQKEDWETALLWYQNAQRMGMELRSTVAYLRYLTLEKAGRKEEADQALRTAIDIDRGWVDGNSRCHAWLRWGAHFHEQKRYIKAESVLEAAIARCPELPSYVSMLSEMYRFLALSQWAQGKIDQAVLNAQKAVQLNEKNAWAHIHYGKILYFYDPLLVHQTEHEFAIALEQNPSADIWRNLIGFWQWVGEIERANQMCNQAVSAGLSANLIQECSGQ